MAFIHRMARTAGNFKDWMDERGLSARQVATWLHVEEQTVRHWRSQGIPERRKAHVETFMREFDVGKVATPDPLAELRGRTLKVDVSREQFRAWEAAAHDAGFVHIEDWAVHALAEYAKSESAPGNVVGISDLGKTENLKKVAEESPEYGKTNSPAASGQTSAPGSAQPPPKSESQKKRA